MHMFTMDTQRILCIQASMEQWQRFALNKRLCHGLLKYYLTDGRRKVPGLDNKNKTVGELHVVFLAIM